jgi:hypothetical protein
MQFFGVDLESGIQRQDIDVAARTPLACSVRLLQYDVDRGLRLAIRNNQVDPEAWLPRILVFGFELIVSTEIFQAADLSHDESRINACFREVELHVFQRRWINDSFDLFHLWKVCRRIEWILPRFVDF